MRRVHRVMAAATCAAVSTVALTGAPAAGSQAPPLSASHHPGVYITENPNAVAITGTTSTYTLMVGQGTPASHDVSHAGPWYVPSSSAFTQEITDPSPILAAAVTAYFASGGTNLWLQLTANEASATLIAGLTTSFTPDIVNLISVPALGELSGSDYVAVATAEDQLANRMNGVALLDPSDAVVTQATGSAGPAALTYLAEQLNASLPSPQAAVLFASGLLDAQGDPVPASAAISGLIAQHDQDLHIWASLGGLDEPLSGLQPTWSVSNAALATLGAAGVDGFRAVTGYGTVLWGDLTLADSGAAANGARSLGARRLLDQITDVIKQQVFPQVVFQPNDASTWQSVTASISTYLNTVWQNGGLHGANPSQAFQVNVGLGSTMTSQDILNGEMIVQVQVALQQPNAFTTLTATQAMAGP